MAVFNGVFPIIPGERTRRGETLRPPAWVSAARSSMLRRRGRDLSGRLGLYKRLRWGSFMVVWFEAPDVEKAFTELATSDEEFSTWFRGQVKDVTGVDLGAPPEGPLPDLLVDWDLLTYL